MTPRESNDEPIDILYFLEYRASIEGLRMEPVYPDSRWLAQCAEHGLCPVCKHVDRSRYPMPFDIVLSEAPVIDDEVAFAVETLAVTIWKRSYVEMISRDLREYAVGRCLLPDHTAFEDFVTCYRPTYIIVGGGKQSRYLKCPRCGTVDYEPVGPWHIAAFSLTNDRVFQDARCQFYLTEAALSEYQAQSDLPLLPKGIGVSRISPDHNLLNDA